MTTQDKPQEKLDKVIYSYTAENNQAEEENQMLRDTVTRLDQELHAGSYLLRREIEEVGAVARRDDQGVARTHRVAVARGVGKAVLPRHGAWNTEDAGVVGVARAGHRTSTDGAVLAA